MKKLISVALLSLLLVPSLAEAKKGVSNQEVRTLITTIRKKSDAVHKKVRAFSDPLIRYAVAPGTNPEQGQSVTVFATLNAGFTDSETFLADAKFDGTNVTLEHPSEGLWIFEAGSFTELLSHTLQATVFIQDAAQAKTIRDAIQSLETQIADLNSQIANATDPGLIAQLTAQRDEKQTLKDSLVAALANLKSAVATEQVSFTVVPATAGTEFPKVTAVEPNFGKFDQAADITITGENFAMDSDITVLVGGLLANSASVSSSTSISANIPAFASPGTKDIEVRFTKDGKTKNAFFRNAYFAGNQAAEIEHAPVANAGINQTILLGVSATFSGAGSYDPNNHQISYSWQVISKPAGSSLAIPTNPPGADVSFSVTPDVPGTYVISLSVFKISPAMVSQPSLTVLEVNPPGNRAPTGSAPSMTTSMNRSSTTQITSSDADFWQSRSFFVTKQSAYGSASVSNTGLVSFQAGASPGSDTIEVSIVDNGTPPMSSVVSIPVTVLNNQPPVIQSTPAAFQRTQGMPYQVRFGLFGIGSGAVTDPDGTIQSLVWDFGDGTHERITDLAAASAIHNYIAPGTYTITLTATDNTGATTSVAGTAVVTDEDIPTAKVKVSQVSGSVPFSVTFDASDSSVQSGSIQQYRWIATGQSTETVTTTPFFSFTFTTPYVSGATPGIRLRIRTGTGATAREGEVNVGVYPGNGGQTNANYSPQQLIGPPREVLINQTVGFDGSRSSTPNPGETISNYHWNFGDFKNCPSCSFDGLTASYAYSYPYNHFTSLQVTTNTGKLSGTNFQELFVTNAGHAPHALARYDRVSGIAPLTVHADCGDSYDYDGTLMSNGWGWGYSDGSPFDNSGPTVTHTFNNPGVYNMFCQVMDNDLNPVTVNQTITVLASAKDMPLKKSDVPPSDASREYERQVLAGACFQDNKAEACYQLGSMYQEDGDDYTRTKLWEKACGMGYAPACQK